MKGGALSVVRMLLEDFFVQRLHHILVLLCCWLSVSVFANELAPEPSPAEVVESVTSKLLSVAKNNTELLKSSPDQYFALVRSELESSVDFESIAKNVMGKKYWLSATEEQQKQFVEVFTNSLVETYGKGMANFADLDISIESSRPSEKSDKTQYVVQSVKTDSGSSKIVYTMRNVDSVWMLRNVTLDGVNLGKTFRSQFNQAVKDADNDLGLAINSWGQEAK